MEIDTGYPLHRENRENGPKRNPSQGNTGNCVCSSCKLPNSKGKRYFDICHQIFPILFLSWICPPSLLVYVIVTNHVNWHRENLQSDREKTGKTQGI